MKRDTLMLFLILIGTSRWVPSGNEDNYLCLAKAWFDPGWIPGSWILGESAGARGLYNWIVGGLLYYFDFYTVSLTLKFLLSWGYARLLSGYIHPGVLAVVCYCPTFFGGEFIFMGCEPKHFAWLLVFWHLRRQEHHMLFLAAASWFHVLVGGWYALYWLLSHPQHWKTGLGYALLVAPLGYYLAGTQLMPTGAGCDANFIYARLRNLHHCYPLLYSTREVVGFLCCLLAIRFSAGGLSRNIMIGCCALALLTSLYPMDGIVKLIPYRLLALALLLELQHHFQTRSWLQIPIRVLGCACLLYLVATNVKDSWRYATDAPYQALIEQVRQLPPATLIVSERSDFIRRSGRDVFVNTKFIPNSALRICEWQRRQEWVRAHKNYVLIP